MLETVGGEHSVGERGLSWGGGPAGRPFTSREPAQAIGGAAFVRLVMKVKCTVAPFIC